VSVISPSPLALHPAVDATSNLAKDLFDGDFHLI
jgi:hypothetical protein